MLHFQTGGAGTAVFGHQRAKWILEFCPAMNQMLGFRHPQLQRQAGGLVEGILIIPVNLRARQLFNQLSVSVCDTIKITRHQPARQMAINEKFLTINVESWMGISP
jgi:hypothetical protein